MTKGRRADLLLEAASNWQFSEVVENAETFNFPEELWDEFDDVEGQAGWFLMASACLSEVAALGFDLVQADGSEDEP
jgi:hypothetical protein